MFEPRSPLTAAELHVDFPAVNNHIVERRGKVETYAAGQARRLGYSIGEQRAIPHAVQATLADRLRSSLAVTAEFGFSEVRREIRSLRRTTFALAVTDAGAYSERARGGLEGIADHVRQRAREAAAAIAAAALEAANREHDPVVRTAVAAAAAVKALHNEVLTLVGETLNMGRTAGALSLKTPPEFALRSEQLDKNTCDACTSEHGGIYVVDSNEYYQHLPPSYCYGGGRCRGIMVFGDGPADVRQPETEQEAA